MVTAAAGGAAGTSTGGQGVHELVGVATSPLGGSTTVVAVLRWLPSAAWFELFNTNAAVRAALGDLDPHLVGDRLVVTVAPNEVRAAVQCLKLAIDVADGVDELRRSADT